MKKRKKILAILSCLTLVFGLFLAEKLDTKAATKAQLEDSKLTISIGKQEYRNIYIYNKVDGAKYSYKSSNTKIVKVDKNGELTGIKAGKAKITVTQLYKKKKTKVGTCSIVVKSAKIAQNSFEVDYRRGTMSEYEYEENNLKYWGIIDYPATNAKYTYVSSDPSILKIDKNGVIIEENRPGKTVTVTVKETLNKKTKTIGKVKITIRTPKLSIDSLDIGLNETFYPFSYFTGYFGAYYIVTSDKAEPEMDNSNVVEAKEDTSNPDKVLSFEYEDGSWYGVLKGQKLGTAYVHCYTATCAEEISSNTYIGTIKVTVKEMKATLLEWDDEFGDLDENGVIQESYSDMFNEYTIYYNYEPYNCTDHFSVTVDNDVVKVDNENSTMGRLHLIINKEGTTTITVKLGDRTITKKIKFIRYDD